MAVKRIEVYQSIKTVLDCSLYSDDLRMLFGLPKRSGKIIGVLLRGQTVEIQFQINRSKFIIHKFTGGK